MNGSLLIVLGIIVVIGAALFGDQVIALFAGMTPLESLRMIVTFILHVAVATILSYAALTAPELLKPWLKTLRRKRRGTHRGASQPAAPRTPRMNYSALANWLLKQQSQPKQRQQPPMVSTGDDDNRLNF